MSAGDQRAAIGRTVRFGVFEVDFAAVELRKRGRRVKLEAQPFQVLSILVRRPGELTNREDLRQELWPADTFVEFDHSLNTAVKKIRQALEDSPRSPRYIETVPRQGYRFIAAVESEPMQPTGSQGPTRLRRLFLFVVASLLIGLSLLGWLVQRDPPIKEMVSRPLTSYPGEETFASFSPDGSEVAFQWNGMGDERNTDIYIKQLGVDQPSQLIHHSAPDIAPAWSPDGQLIAFARYLSAGRVAYIVKPQRGGRERTIAEYDVPELLDARWARAKTAWTPDGKWLVVTGSTSPGDRFGLTLVSLETREERRLTEPPNNGNVDFDAAVSPDGRKLVFCRHEGRYDLYLLRLSDDLHPEGEPKRLTFDNPWNMEPVWTPDSREIVFTSGSHLNNRELWRMVVAQSARPRRLAFKERIAHSPAISRDGERLAYTASRLNRDIWRLELPAPGEDARRPVRFLDSTWFEGGQRYSPDGSKIAFVSQRSGLEQIWVSERDGSYPQPLTSFAKGIINRPRWSHSGEHIVFYSSAEGDTNVYVIPSSGGVPKRLTSNPAHGSNPDWSSDGRYVYFESDRDGTMEIWKVSAEGGDPVALDVEGSAPVESHDGKYLYFQKDGSVWRVPLEGGATTLVVESIHRFSEWLLQKDRIYFFSAPDEDAKSHIRYKDLVTDSIHTVLPVEQPWWYITVSPDRGTILYSQIDDAGSDLMLVENFR